MATKLKENNSSISELALSGNRIDDNCLVQLSEYVQSSKDLQVLYVGREISDDGVEMLCKNIKGNTVLKELYLGYNNKITDKSIPMLINLIESTYLERLLVQHSSITQYNIFVLPLVNNAMKCGSSSLELSDM